MGSVPRPPAGSRTRARVLLSPASSVFTFSSQCSPGAGKAGLWAPGPPGKGWWWEGFWGDGSYKIGQLGSSLPRPRLVTFRPCLSRPGFLPRPLTVRRGLLEVLRICQACCESPPENPCGIQTSRGGLCLRPQIIDATEAQRQRDLAKGHTTRGPRAGIQVPTVCGSSPCKA